MNFTHLFLNNLDLLDLLQRKELIGKFTKDLEKVIRKSSVN